MNLNQEYSQHDRADSHHDEDHALPLQQEAMPPWNQLLPKVSGATQMAASRVAVLEKQGVAL